MSHNPNTKSGHSHWKLPSDKNCLLLSSHQQPLLERFLNRAAEGFQNLFTAVEDHFELCLAKCRTSSQVSVIMLVYVALACLWHSRPENIKILCSSCWCCSPCHVLTDRVKSSLPLSCFRASNMKTPTGTHRRSTATARVHQNCCPYDCFRIVWQRASFE